MGRTLKRVALDFKWPLNKTWEGFLNPFWNQSIKCTECDGSGSNPGADILYNLAYVHKYYDICKLMPKCDIEPLKQFAISIMNKKSLGIKFFNHAKYHGFNNSKLEQLEPLRDKVFNSEIELWIELIPIIDSWGISVQQQLNNLINEHASASWTAAFGVEEFEVLLKCGEIPSDYFPGRIQYRFDEEEKTWISLDRDRTKDHKEWKWVPCEKPELPSVELLKKYFNSALSGSGSVYYCAKEKAKKEGWAIGKCECCSGEGHVWPSKEVKNQYDNWTESEPPAGEGFQLWETTSEGSPTSPVFETLDALCEYAAENCSTFADFKASKEEWKQMLGDDMVVTPMLDNDGNKTGVVFI